MINDTVIGNHVTPAIDTRELEQWPGEPRALSKPAPFFAEDIASQTPVSRQQSPALMLAKRAETRQAMRTPRAGLLCAYA